MRILITYKGTIPAYYYGGTQRGIWSLGKELVKMGHDVNYLVGKGSTCDFAKVIPIDPGREIEDQIPENVDIIHFTHPPKHPERHGKPYIFNMRVNTNDLNDLDINTIFVSQDHADRYGATCYVLNGLDWDDYENPSFSAKRDYFHFLGDAAWRLKNVKGAIHAIKRTKSERIKILGGHRFNIKRGVRWTFTRRASFCGVVGGKEKDQLLMHSKGLVFPVRWDEPCANAVLESLYFGCPVFATPYGCMPEIVTDEFGYLSNKCDDLAEAMEQVDKYSNRRCHEYAVACFNSRRVALSYLEKYEKVLAGETLNSKPPRLKKLLDRKFLPWYE